MTVDVLHFQDLARFHREYYARNRPVIIRGVREALALKVFSWSAEYFVPVLGDREVPVIASQGRFLSYERDVQQLPYREFVARSFGAQRVELPRYYFKNPTGLLPPGHEDAERIEPLARYLRRALLRNLWISGEGTAVGLHFDHAENLNFQLRGEKVFSLFPPGVRPYYPMPMFSETAHISRVFRDGPRPDLTRFPAFDPSRELRIHLREGEILYLPAYWWHQVESLGEQNVNLNFWWLPGLGKQLANWNQALRGHYQLWLRYFRYGSITGAARKTPEAGGR